MTKAAIYLDCCQAPVLETVKSFLSTECDMVAIRRCRKCGCHWFYRLKECITELDVTRDDASANEYDRQIWYVRLTPDEAETLMRSEDMPDPSIFAGRPCFVRDADGMKRSEGIPYFLR